MTKTEFKILIAENDDSHAFAICRSIEKDYPGVNITVVKSLFEYHKTIGEYSPTIALVDLHLSDGMAMGILTSPAEEGVFPIILMTSYGSEQIAVDAIKAGALDYIVKSPEVFKSIAAIIEGALREWQLLQEKKQMIMLLKESQARIIQQEKMASIGQLAAGVAHEINNPMGYISSNISSLIKYVEKITQFLHIQEQVIEKYADLSAKSEIAVFKKQIKLDYILNDLNNLMEESLEGSRRVSKIVQDLKSFSRDDHNEAKLSDINEYIRSTINIVNNEIKYVAELDLQLGEIPPVLCNPQQIGQVVMNLLVNAAHSITDKGTITLTTSRTDKMVDVSVTDTGCGISPQNMKKIFEPFFTTKEPGKGTGLGLAISLDIIKKHGGELLVQSKLGKGTTFIMRLPIDGTDKICNQKQKTDKIPLSV